MASILKVDKLDPQSGTDLEIGTSGDTVTVPSGATLTVSGTMNASSITAGTMATARLGSGTASSSTILYGDQTYKTEPSAGAALTGSTDNTVVTVTGANAIQGESSMTYDGTTLALTTSGGGLKLDNLGSSDVHTLDDYEEGTWTPTIKGSSGATTGQTYGTQQGNYTKVGNLLTLQAYVTLTAKGTIGGTYLVVGGFPFTSVTTIDNGACSCARVEQIRVSTGWIGPDMQLGSGVVHSIMMEHEASASASVSHRAVGGVGPQDSTTDTTSIAFGGSFQVQ